MWRGIDGPTEDMELKAMYFKPYYLGCLAHASYMIGAEGGPAAVIDPRRDVDEYIADAERAGLTIRFVIETHLHADFVSGHVELARRTGAQILIGDRAGATFPHIPITNEMRIELGDVSLTFRTTPGHTPESVIALVTVAGDDNPRLIFTGDTLFIGDVGRPDLAGSRGYSAEQMARLMFASLRDSILTLPDAAEVWPAHGAGSSCGKALSNDRASTIGREKALNPALRYVLDGDEEGFVQYHTEGLSAAPGYFGYDAQRNREGAAPLAEATAGAVPLSPAEVEELSESGVLVLDVRSVADFGSAHIPGALHVQLEGTFAPWVGRVARPEERILVVAEVGAEHEAIMRLARVGYENIAGYLEGGMAAWNAAGGEQAAVPQLPADTPLMPRRTVVVDVRSREEYDAGHLEGALHIPLPELVERIDELPPAPLALMCGTGYRSSIACSLLLRAGRREVLNLAGGWEAASKARTGIEPSAHVA
ncbi:MAG: MBL fold metallo-hydrolase [Armatimonadetes bacterium]|nr:MBL fold metallo-hydrolase [Armatimonadota bacterium]MDE2205852.1 MBL fold metallo-hydrolase [Armatimonadota bacterium]